MMLDVSAGLPKANELQGVLLAPSLSSLLSSPGRSQKHQEKGNVKDRLLALKGRSLILSKSKG